jgi:hypothetical protein
MLEKSAQTDGNRKDNLIEIRKVSYGLQGPRQERAAVRREGHLKTEIAEDASAFFGGRVGKQKLACRVSAQHEKSENRRAARQEGFTRTVRIASE